MAVAGVELSPKVKALVVEALVALTAGEPKANPPPVVEVVVDGLVFKPNPNGEAVELALADVDGAKDPNVEVAVAGVEGVPNVSVATDAEVVAGDEPNPKRGVEGVEGLDPKPNDPKAGWAGVEAVLAVAPVDVAMRELPKEKPLVAAGLRTDETTGVPKPKLKLDWVLGCGVPSEPKVTPVGFAAVCVVGVPKEKPDIILKKSK